MKKSLLAIVTLFISTGALALPPWFLGSGTGNERDVEWNRLETERFSVYHDEKAANLGYHILGSLEDAYPFLSHLLRVKIGNDTSPDPAGEKFLHSNFERVPVIVSSRDQ